MAEPTEEKPIVPAEEEPKAPEVTPVTPETPESKPEAPATPEVEKEDLEIDTTQIEAEVTKKVTEKLLKSLTGGSEEEVTNATGEQSPWAKEGRNPKDYDEIAEWTTQLAIKRQEELKAKEAEENKRKEEEVAKFQTERAQSFNKYWDNQLNELYEAGKLPKIEDEKNENDPGIRARKSLFTKMVEVNEQRVKDSKEPIYSLKEIFYEYPINEEPGMSAPVSAGRGAVPAEGESYEYVGNKSFFDILKGAIGR